MQFFDPKGSFLKNAALSLLLLAVGSLLIPAALKQIDDRKFADQQRLQAELSRQDKIIDAQSKLLDTLAADFWNYETYASAVLYSRHETFGRDDWHQRAVAAYYENSGPLIVQMRADISLLLRLAPRPTYEAFLQLYEDEVLPYDSCLLELMKIEATATPTPTGEPLSARCIKSEGKFAGATWGTLIDYVSQQYLADTVDQELEDLARAFGLAGPSDVTLSPTT